MSTPCQTCIPLDCTLPDDIAQFSNTGYTFWNPQYGFVVNCPPGYQCLEGIWPRIITIPEGEIEISVPTSPNGQLILRCCESTITRDVPVGATAAQIELIANSMIYECAAQQARCNNLIQPPRPTKRTATYRYYTNTEVMTWECDAGLVDINAYNSAISSRVGVNEGVITVAPAAYSTVSPAFMASPDKYLYSSIGVPNVNPTNAQIAAAIADAKINIQLYMLNLFNTLVSQGFIKCGYLNTEQEYTASCDDPADGPDVTVTIAAGEYSSQVSQADADLQAKTAAKNQAEAALSCGCDNPNVPFPPALVETTGVDIEDIDLSDDETPVAFANADGGSYQLKYTSGAFRLNNGSADVFYTADHSYYAMYKILKADWSNTVTAATQTNTLSGAIPNSNAATVVSQSAALNPLATFVSSEEITCEVTTTPWKPTGGLVGFASLIPPYTQQADTTKFTLYQVKKVLYEQPLRLQIANYAAVATAMTPCATCDAAVSAAWDGKVPRRKFLELSLDEPVWVYDVTVEGDPDVSIGSWEMDSIYIDYVPGSSYWYISLYAKEGAGYILIWGGYKDKGTTAEGCYTQDDGECDGPNAITLEEY